MLMKLLVAALITGGVLALAAAPATANPGTGNSFSCAPGQQGNQDPGWKPPACDK
jgi:hypothetical protein